MPDNTYYRYGDFDYIPTYVWTEAFQNWANEYNTRNRPVGNEEMLSSSSISRIVGGFVHNRRLGYHSTMWRDYLTLNSNAPQWLKDAITNSDRYRDHEQEFRDLDPRIDSCLIECEECGRFANIIDTLVITREDETRARCCGNCLNGRQTHEWMDGTIRYYREPRIAGYHEIPRTEIFDGVDFKDPTLLGIELETFVPGSQEDILHLTEEAAKIGPLIAERDGSLDQRNGVEFVFAPTPFKNVKKGEYVDNIVNYLRENKVEGWRHKGYGMHISINSKMMTRLEVAKYVHFINKNQHLCELVGGRSSNHYSVFTARRLAFVQDNKYAAARHAGGRVEIRFFQSSLKWERIERNCQFANAVRQFVKVASMRRLDSDTFKSFVDDQKEYKLLNHFLKNTKSKELAFTQE